MTPLVLVVDDDAAILELVRYNLIQQDLRVLTASTGKEAATMMDTADLDLVILDLNLPELSGLDLCRRFRQRSKAPLIILTARYNETDRVRLLEAGADDYLTKPFSLKELMARVKAQLRRWSWSDTQSETSETLTVGPLTLDPVAHTVTFRGAPLQLTPMEFAILGVLCRAPGRVFPRERLLALATGQEVSSNARNVDVHIRSLRLKLEDDPANPQFLETVRGAGYRIGQQPNA